MPSLSDNVAVSESLSYYSDQVDTIERIAISLSATLLTVSDTATLSENTKLEIESAINKSDTATVSESVNNSIALNASTNDTATLTENVSAVIVIPQPDINITVTNGVQQTGGVRIV
jgi:hypothetical protein